LNKEFYLKGKKAMQSTESTNVLVKHATFIFWVEEQSKARNQHEADSKKLVSVLGLCLVVPHVLYC
jgi:hypothetical protein